MAYMGRQFTPRLGEWWGYGVLVSGTNVVLCVLYMYVSGVREREREGGRGRRKEGK